MLVSKITTCFTRHHIQESLERSLERLQTDRLDVYLFHNFDTSTPVDRALEAMENVRALGLTSVLGCSNFSGAQLREALNCDRTSIPSVLKVVEAVYNLALPGIEEEIMPICSQEELGLLTYSPLGAGFLSGKYSGDRNALPIGSRFHVIPGHTDLYFCEEAFRALRELCAFEADCGIPRHLLALAWVLAHPSIDSVLFGARNISQVQNAIAAYEIRCSNQVHWPPHLTPKQF